MLARLLRHSIVPKVGPSLSWQVTRPASNLAKILKRELKHDVDAGGKDMPEDLAELQKTILKTMTIIETPGEAVVKLVSKKPGVTITFDIRVSMGLNS